jgi:hypothetical protein
VYFFYNALDKIHNNLFILFRLGHAGVMVINRGKVVSYMNADRKNKIFVNCPYGCYSHHGVVVI